MVHTVNDVLLSHILHRLLHHGFVAVLYDAGHLARPQYSELLLDLREYELDRVVFRGVRHVEDQPEAQSSRLLLGLVALVGREVVQEEGDLLLAVL